MIKTLRELFVDRVRQSDIFRKIIEGQARRSIMVITAGSGLGKSWLLRILAYEAGSRNLPLVQIDFADGQAYDALTLVRRCRDAFGAEYFGALDQVIIDTTTARVALTTPGGRPAGPINVSLGSENTLTSSNITVSDIGNTVIKDNSFVIQTDNPIVRQAIEDRINAAFFENLSALAAQKRVVFLFDTYERASLEADRWSPSAADRWIMGQLLGRIRDGKLSNLAIALAGRRVPGFSVEWNEVLGQVALDLLECNYITEYLRERRGLAHMIVANFQRVLAEAGPRQAEVLRRCAIPRWFDLDVLATLRERADGNERVLALLSGYSFVRPIGDGRYAYQDEVRAMLLAEWRAQQPGEYRVLNRRLANHFADRAAASQPDELQLPNMLLLVRPRRDWDLWEREALYHRLIADPPVGLAQLRSAFDQAEAGYRLAEALLQVANDVPLDEASARWVRYMRARIERAALHLDAAIAQLEALLAEPALDPQLAAEAGQTLGDALTETGQWARAIELYRGSLGFFQQAGDQHRAADVMLRLGEAYRGLGVNTGGWYVPAFPQNTRLRALGQAWYWLLGLPFIVVAAFLRRTPWTLPLSQYVAPYQNWLLIRLYRTAQGWYEPARIAFSALGDQLGTLRAEQRQAQILLLFGYADQALAWLDQLRARLAPRDTYRRLWVDNDRAAALITRGDIDAAQDILAETLAGFRAIGDFRGEAAALALQGRAAAAAGTAEAALASYRDSLARFRMLRYAAAREQALYALRAWQRHVGPGPISQQINQLLEQEQEKRYIARFPRSLLPLLQALVLGIVPLALALTALVAPNQIVQRVGNSALVQAQTVYDLWSALGALVILGVLGLGVYTVVALALIFFIPLEALEHEQPDFLITNQQGITRYDYRGAGTAHPLG